MGKYLDQNMGHYLWIEPRTPFLKFLYWKLRNMKKTDQNMQKQVKISPQALKKQI